MNWFLISLFFALFMSFCFVGAEKNARLDKRGNDILSALESHREKQAGICPSKPHKHHEKQIERIIIEVVVVSITLETTIVEVHTKTETLTKTKKSIHSASTRRSTVNSNHTPKRHKTLRTQIPTSRRTTVPPSQIPSLSRSVSSSILSLPSLQSFTSISSIIYSRGSSVISSLSPSISPSAPSQQGPFCYSQTLYGCTPFLNVIDFTTGAVPSEVSMSLFCGHICASTPGCVFFQLVEPYDNNGPACYFYNTPFYFWLPALYCDHYQFGVPSEIWTACPSAISSTLSLPSLSVSASPSSPSQLFCLSGTLCDQQDFPNGIQAALGLGFWTPNGVSYPTVCGEICNYLSSCVFFQFVPQLHEEGPSCFFYDAIPTFSSDIFCTQSTGLYYNVDYPQVWIECPLAISLSLYFPPTSSTPAARSTSPVQRPSVLSITPTSTLGLPVSSSAFSMQSPSGSAPNSGGFCYGETLYGCQTPGGYIASQQYNPSSGVSQSSYCASVCNGIQLTPPCAAFVLFQDEEGVGPICYFYNTIFTSADTGLDCTGGNNNVAQIYNMCPVSVPYNSLIPPPVTVSSGVPGNPGLCLFAEFHDCNIGADPISATEYIYTPANPSTPDVSGNCINDCLSTPGCVSFELVSYLSGDNEIFICYFFNIPFYYYVGHQLCEEGEFPLALFYNQCPSSSGALSSVAPVTAFSTPASSLLSVPTPQSSVA